MSEHRSALQRSSYFKGLSTTEIDQVVGLAQDQAFSRGDRLVEQSSEGQQVFLLLSGRAEVLLHRADGPIATIGELEIVGERALLGGRRRSATVRAKDDVTVLCWDAEDLLSLMATHHTLGLKIMRSLALKLSDRLDDANHALRNALS